MSFAAIASLVGAAIQSAQAYQTNKQNIANQMSINKDNISAQLAVNADQIAVAQMNNQTAIDLANTAHQREVQDLRDAGLNPILSAGGSGSSTPTLQSPDMNAPISKAVQVENPLKDLGVSAREVGKILEGTIGAQVQYQQAQTDYTNEVKRGMQIENDRAEAVKDLESFYAELEMEGINAIRSDAYHKQYGGHGSIAYPNELVTLIKEGIISDLKNRSNQNWRANLGALLNGAGAAAGGAGALGSAALNSAKAAKLLKFIK